jgi:hypothetical protein
VTGQTPAQAAAHAFVTGCVNRGISASNAAVPAECQLGAVKELWADVARAANAAQDVPGQVRLARQDRDQLRKAVLDLAAKWDAAADRNQRNGQSLVDQGDEYGNEGLAVAEALGACVVELRKIAEPPS